MTGSIESLGWLRVGFSGIRLDLDPEYDDSVGGGYAYKSHALVLGWWVYRWRVWRRSPPLVHVPVDLLRRVLHQAAWDNRIVEGEFASSEDERSTHWQEQKDIDDLMDLAGIEKY